MRILKSHQCTLPSLHPSFITGFTDAEGCFSISVIKNNKLKTGWRVELFYQISLHRKDQALLEQVQKFFNVGNITNSVKDSIQFRVTSLQDLTLKVLPHFDKYPLITQKQADFELFKQAVEILCCKEHITIEGINKLIAIKASMNLGLSNVLKAAFPNIIPVHRPSVLVGGVSSKIKDSNWLVGFTTGEGCFYINIFKSKAKLGVGVQLVFQITQDNRDQELMNSLISYFDCGYIKIKNKSQFTWLDFIVTKFSCARYIDEKIIPFFSKNKILGVKLQDFKDWCKAAELIKNKAHLTTSGLEEIRKIKAGMNKARS